MILFAIKSLWLMLGNSESILVAYLLFLVLAVGQLLSDSKSQTEQYWKVDRLRSQERTFDILVVEQGAGQVKRLRYPGGECLDSVAVGFNPHEIAISENRQTAFVSNFGVEDYDNTLGIPGTTISVIDILSFDEIAVLPTFRHHLAPKDTLKAPHGVKLHPTNRSKLFVNLEYGDSMLVYDVGTRQIERSFAVPTGTHNFFFSTLGDTLWLFSAEMGVFRMDPTTGEETGHFPTSTAVRGIIFANQGKELIASCQDEIYIIDTRLMEVRRHFSDLGVQQIIYSTASAEGKYILAPCPYDGVVLVLDAENGEVLHRLETGRAPIYVQIAPDPNLAFVSNALDDHMSVIDLRDFSFTDFGKVNKPNGFAFVE